MNNNNVVLVIVSCVGTILLLDLVLRLPVFALRFYSGPAAYYINRFPKMHKTLRHSPSINLEALVAGDLSWISGESDKKERKIKFITDASGFRNTRDYNNASFDTIVLGDSFGVAGVTDQDELLVENLNRRGHNVYNISTDMIGLWDETVTMRYHVKHNLHMKQEKRLIWLLFEGNDLEGRFAKELDPDKLVNSLIKEMSVHLENYYKRSLIKLMVKRLLNKVKNPKSPVIKRKIFEQDVLFYQSYVDILQMRDEDIVSHKNYEGLKRIFSSMVDYCEAENITLYCVVIPVKARVYEWVLNNKEPWSSSTEQSAFARLIEDLSSRRGVSFIDLGPVFIEESKRVFDESGETLYWPDDTHWNGVGQSLAAKVIDQELRN